MEKPCFPGKKKKHVAILKSWRVLEAAKAEQQQQQERDTKEWAAQRGFVLGAVPWPCGVDLLLEG